MPWIGCELWVGEIAEDGSIAGTRRIAGGDDESIFQPEWSPGRGALFRFRPRPARDRRALVEFVPGAGRGARRRLGDRAGLAVGRRIRPAAVEFPHVDLCLRVRRTGSSAAISKTACIGSGSSISSSLRRARSRPPTRTFPSLRAAGGRLYFRGGSPSEPPAIVELDLASGRTAILRRSTTQDIEAYRGYLSAPEPVSLRHRERRSRPMACSTRRATRILQHPRGNCRHCSCIATAARPPPPRRH